MNAKLSELWINSQLDSATAATLALSIVDTVSDDDFVLAGDAICATSADTASVTTRRPVVWDICIVKIDARYTPRSGFWPVLFVLRYLTGGSGCVRTRYRQHVYR
jgi:hypothetical protein